MGKPCCVTVEVFLKKAGADQLPFVSEFMIDSRVEASSAEVLDHLKHCSGQITAVGCVEFCTTDDDQSQSHWQSKCTKDQVLDAWVRLLYVWQHARHIQVERGPKP